MPQGLRGAHNSRTYTTHAFHPVRARLSLQTHHLWSWSCARQDKYIEKRRRSKNDLLKNDAERRVRRRRRRDALAAGVVCIAAVCGAALAARFLSGRASTGRSNVHGAAASSLGYGVVPLPPNNARWRSMFAREDGPITAVF